MDTRAEGYAADVEVTLRVMGEDLRPAEVSRRLGVDPDKAHAKGAVPPSAAGTRGRPYKEGFWGYTLKGSDRMSMEESLVAMLSFVAERSGAIRELQSLGMRVDLFLGVFSEDANFGATLTPSLLRGFGELGLDLHLDLYWTGE